MCGADEEGSSKSETNKMQKLASWGFDGASTEWGPCDY